MHGSFSGDPLHCIGGACGAAAASAVLSGEGREACLCVPGSALRQAVRNGGLSYRPFPRTQMSFQGVGASSAGIP